LSARAKSRTRTSSRTIIKKAKKAGAFAYLTSLCSPRQGTACLVYQRTTLQPADWTAYSRPYVAEYFHPRPAGDPGDRLCLADACGADATTQKRRARSSLWEWRDGKYLWSPDRNGAYQSHSLSRLHFLRTYFAADGADREAERGSPCWRSRERGAQSSCFAQTERNSLSRRNRCAPSIARRFGLLNSSSFGFPGVLSCR
jgi:hypothetical protein